ncbi:MAG: hypothetical protein IKU42_06290, partial [Oscillospiraceae bacterium]|nr:hypothetical protein [Oscillospiraceae bacterium]
DKANDGNHNCDVCGKENVSEHDYEEEVTNPTCEDKGFTTYTCSECGYSYNGNFVGARGHKDENNDHVCDNECGKSDMGEHKDSANDDDHICDYCKDENDVLEECSDKANDGNHNCDVCGKENVSEHDYEEEVTDPTCGEKGFTTHICSECSDSYVDTYVGALGHTNEGEKYVPANCTNAAKCGRCGESYGEIAPDAHRWGEVVLNWSDDGKTCVATMTCEINGEHKKTAEGKVSSEVAEEPTCSEKGDTEYTVEFEEDWAKAKNGASVVIKDDIKTDSDAHKVSSEWTGKDGKHYHACENGCDNRYDEEDCHGGEATCAKKAICEVCNESYGELLEHEYGDWVVIREATSKKEGLERRYCVCGDYEERNIAKLPYNPDRNPDVIIVGKADDEINPSTGAPVIGAVVSAAICAAAYFGKKRG